MLVTTHKKKAVVGLSGGVDSAVAASIIKDKGYEVLGVFMITGQLDCNCPKKTTCVATAQAQDIERAKEVARKLDIEFIAVDMREPFKHHVIDYVISQYLKGVTPNPCVICNEKIKFGLLPERLRAMGIDFDVYVTGHYAVLKYGPALFKGVDPSRDQSYFLYRVDVDILRKTVFPLGDMYKSRVKELARTLGVFSKGESRDFLVPGIWDVMFEQKEGRILDLSGRLLGNHRGIHRFTIGQRRNLGVSSSERLYVYKIDAINNDVILAPRNKLMYKGLLANNLKWIPKKLDTNSFECQAKVRLKSRAVDAYVEVDDDIVKVMFKEDVFAVTPGQSVVFYQGDRVIGGGIIQEALA